MICLRVAARCPTNLVKVREVSQGSEEPPSKFLERLMEAYHKYIAVNPESEEQRVAVAMAIIGQSALDIRRKLQRVNRL